ncbi:hypothetical protein GCM10027445_06170 [Amycolatopsis endophytica]|uniref:DUF6801 domain-containing protein n=1 Tax=Amycolatopsis endophytica TaxID=860233 RepID=A0A853AW58_9PSEU|nr:DUF6801 domain-containing protein [Amycolatopsis endophytica]NYI86857.1 hypothetical protein [Amycolatopsis endophytica]
MSQTRLRRRVAAILTGVTTLLALTLTGTATALPARDVPDIGVDTGRFSLPINCAITLPDFGGVKVLDLGTTVDVQGAVAAQLGPGQEFWLTQGSGSITFPEALTALAGVAGIDKADATISALNIGAANATPARINVADPPAEIKDIPIQAGQPLKVGLPLEGTFDVGPFTAPDSGTVTLQFVDAVAHVALKSAVGFTLNVEANCTPTAGNALLTIAVGGPAGQPPSKITGAPMNYSVPPAESLIGIINAPYHCTLGGQPLDVGIAVGGTIPLAVKAGGSLSFTDASGALTIPPATVNALLDAGVHTVSGRVTTQNLVVEGGTPAVQNVAADGIDIPETTLVRDQKVVLSLPANGTLTAGPFKPVAGADSVRISLGDAAADFRINGSTQTIRATCATPSPQVILVDNPVT